MKKNLVKTALLISVCAVGLSACETMDSAWNDVTGESTPYAGNIQPQQQPMPPMQPQMAGMQQQMPAYPAQPMMAQQPVVPAAAMQPTMQYPQQMAQQQPAQTYAPNLASVPARPDASQLPSQYQVQATRQQLANDNGMLTGYLRDPSAPTQTAAAPAQQGTQTYVQQAGTTAPPIPMQAAAAQQASNLIEGQVLGLQPTATGQYALTPLAAEAPMGGFALASSLQFAPGTNQVSMPQYQQLKTVAGQYALQPGRVRVVSYGDAQNSKALQNATTTAAYLVDMGVPANAIRVKIDNSSAAPVGQSKTDIFLETPAQR